jgi:hypothetical protein
MSDVGSEMDPALQAILEEWNMLSAGQDQLVAYQEELKMDKSSGQDKLVPCQDELNKGHKDQTVWYRLPRN